MAPADRAGLRAGRLLAAAALLLAVLAPAACRELPPFRFDFEREADLDELGWNCRTLLRLSERFSTSGARGLEVEFHPDRSGGDGNHPGLTLRRFDGDWSSRRALLFEAFNPESSPIVLGIRVEDRKNPPAADRYNGRQPLAPGPNRVRVPLTGLSATGTGRTLDLDSIRAVGVFLSNPDTRHTLYLDNFRLE